MAITGMSNYHYSTEYLSCEGRDGFYSEKEDELYRLVKPRAEK